MDYQLIASPDDLIVKLGVLIQSLNQGQKFSMQLYTTDQGTLVSRFSPPTQPHRSSTLPLSLKNDVKDKNIEINNRSKGPRKKIFKIGSLLNARSAKDMDI